MNPLYCRAYIDSRWRYFIKEQIVKVWKRGLKRGKVTIQLPDGKKLIPASSIIEVK